MRFVRTLATVVLVVALVVGLVVGFLFLTRPEPTAAGGWTWLEEMASARGEVASTVGPLPDADGEGLYVIGGFSGLGRTVDDVAAYDPTEDRWVDGPALPEGRHHAAATTVDGLVLVTGGATGATGWEPTTTAWILRPGEATWEEVEPMPEPRDGHRMVTVDGRAYVVGGHGPSADVLVWEPGEGWSRGAAMPSPRHHLAAVVHEGRIWTIGGRDDDEGLSDAVHVYDPGEDAWDEGPDLEEPLSAAVAGVLDGRIHVVGGEDPSLLGGTIDRHLWLEPGGEGWEAGPRPPLAVHGAAGGVLDGTLVLAGGASRQGLLSVVSWTDFAARYDHAERP